MPRRTEFVPDGAWPRLMSIRRAAAYCDLSPAMFAKHVPVAPRLFGNRKRWDRRELDRWLDGELREGEHPADHYLGLLDNDRENPRHQARPR